MKKFISVLLVILMLSTTLITSAGAASAEKKEKSPIIFIAGSSVDICDAEGNEIPTGFDVLTDDDDGEGMSTDSIIEAVMNILKPFLLEGLPFDKWENYGKALYDELAPIWDETQLDGDGNAKYGTGVSAAEIAKWDKKAQTVNTGSDGTFKTRDYDFRYDWRLSPYDHVDRLHEYIKTILKTTGCDQVCLVGRCLGGSIITAYLDTYGSEGLVKKVFYDEVMSNGSSIINDIFSGQIEFSDKHTQAYLLQASHFGSEGVGVDLEGMSQLLTDIIKAVLDYTTKAGILESVFGGVECLYDRLYHVFIPALLRATGIATWANYWCSVYEEDFDVALDLIFGAEGTATREENAGLVEKIQYIREHMVEAKPELYKKFHEEYGVEIGIMAGYGLANGPIMEHYDETSDAVVGFVDASFGGTAAGLFDTFSDEYIARREAEGLGQYISPDKKVDASTCLFPETTWIIKNKHHDYYASVVYLAEYFTQYTNVTADSNNRNISRFLVFDKSATGEFVNMTEENMADGWWLTDVEQKPTFKSVFVAFFDMMKLLFEGLKTLLADLFAK